MQIKNCKIKKMKINISKYYLKNSQTYISNFNKNKKSIKFTINEQIIKIIKKTKNDF